MIVDIIEIVREAFEKKHSEGLPLDKIHDCDNKFFYVSSETRWAFEMFLRGYTACLGSPMLTRYIEQHNSMMTDFDFEAWESIKRAVAESPWIPENYTANDWIADFCDFLKTPRGE